MTQETKDSMSDQKSDSATASASQSEEKMVQEETIGLLLKREREKQGFTYGQVSEKTKLRPNILKALENESWEDLPSSVFAGGFVRAYGLALGLEEKMVMNLFQKNRPHNKKSDLTPLIPPTKSHRIYGFLLIFILLALISSYFLWKGYTTPQKVMVTSDSRAVTKRAGSNLESREEITPSNPEEQLSTGIKDNASDKSSITLDVLLVDGISSEDSDNAEIIPQESLDEGVPITPETDMILMAKIHETTWLKIFVDARKPREYIFKPGERFTWKGRTGFDLLIGNAGGIDLVLDGKPIEISDSPGKVIRLQLPKGYEREKEQE